jgi:hypothetical protein
VIKKGLVGLAMLYVVAFKDQLPLASVKEQRAAAGVLLGAGLILLVE